MKLTKDQKALMTWFNENNTVSLYSDYFPKDIKLTTSSRSPIRIFKPTIQKLYKLGLIQYMAICDYGIRWDQFSISAKGRELVWKGL
ncbi:hypothetical protein L0B53_05990 [Vibrio sp. SS-MA-C1-2]|uniref:hypothetical protein n=1 Tax=Vibrio sp. SS-MA-C1-2 TaxID=2908646 RepID=UPI001F47BBF6|nr:hypothetical protein [Vibrio sp. SS-MA-C1-2]UJF19127.1 hypothetical protein L0B53_05990 [Vibrio sp. SS-MA-C1-2]